jgi:hypothetical protein
MDAALICDSEKSQPGAIASFLFDVPGGKQDPNNKSSTPRPRWRGTSYTSDTQNAVDLNSAKDAPRYFHLLSDRDLLELRAIAEVIVQQRSEIVRDSYQKYLVHFGDSATLPRSGLRFQTICEFLGIDPGQLLERLKSLDDGEFPRRRYRLQRNGRPRILAT